MTNFPRRPERKLTANRIAQYVARNRCERYLHFALFRSTAKRLADRYGVGFDALSPLLSAAGMGFEQTRVDALRAAGERVVDLINKPTADFLAALTEQKSGRAFYFQPTLEGMIGAFACEGRADLIEATRDEDGKFRFTIIDIKASARETVGYRLQVAFYAVLLTGILRAASVNFTAIDGAIALRQTPVAAPDEWQKFDLTLFVDEIGRLISAPDADAARIAALDFAAAKSHLGHHCDGCPYNQICFIRAAEQEDLSLIPHLTATQKHALRAGGFTRARDVARLMRYEGKDFTFAPEHRDAAAKVAAHWAIGANLPTIAQRAHAALARRDAAFKPHRILHNSEWGTLPDINVYPSLVRVYLDAQRDHIADRLYLISALVVAPAGRREIIELATDVPDTDSESELLVRWLQKVLRAINETGDALAPLHIYVFDRRSTGGLLTALERHFAALCAIPAFYDLLTSTPALTQSMISFLSDEVAARMNLGAICANLYEVANDLRFDWKAEGLRARFKTSIFDNRRAFVRDEKLNRYRKPQDAEYQNKERLEWVESAARFGTEIPLEYAYATWGRLPSSSDDKAHERYAETTRGDLLALAAARLRALAHIENEFQYKNRRVEKIALDTERLDETDVNLDELPLHRTLEDFLRLEHYAALQERLQHFALPPDMRTQTGRCAVMRCEKFEKDAARSTFILTDTDGRELGETPNLRFREGDWMTLNPLRDEETDVFLTGKRIVNGRLCVVEKIAADRLTLTLKNFGKAGDSAFRFGHRFLEPEQNMLYTLDEMADDLNADKLLQACQNAESNTLYRWLTEETRGKEPRHIRPSRVRGAAAFARLADAAQRPRGLTATQRAMIESFITDRVVVLQGPPGTGKSHTLGFAALARAAALATYARPFRILVAAKTHAAVKVALESVCKRAAALAALIETNSSSADVLAPLAALRVCKVCNDEAETLPAGVERLMPKGTPQVRPREQWENLMSAPVLCLGGTPGSIYSLVKEATARGKKYDWAAKHFDLVIVDEASQMGQPEALLAAAALRDDGQFIAIGDHRQMPPILAHAWDEEARRNLKHARPHLSIFDALRAQGFASAALDESFRVPTEVAGFLNRHIYAQDDVNFHSHNRAKLAALPREENDCAAWVRHALDPAHTLVCLEHDEDRSQQANEYEAHLIEQLVRAAAAHLGLGTQEGIGVVVPHRAQKFLLQARLPELSAAIDTVERFQGGERDLIIVSATASEREFTAIETDFLLEPRRFTVAVSRPRRKVIVVAARAVFDLMPNDLDAYERGSLWKHLRHEGARHELWRGMVDDQRIKISSVITEKG